MVRVQDPFGARQTFSIGPDRTGQFYSLPHLERTGLGKIARMPVCLRIILESVLRNCDGRRIHVSLTISPIRDEVGRIVGASKIARDITDRKQDEERIYGLMTRRRCGRPRRGWEKW